MLLEVTQHPTDLLVHSVDHRRIDCHALGFRALLIRRQRIPLRPVGMAGIERRVFRDDALRFHVGQALVAQDIIAAAIAVLILLDVFLGGCQRPVRGCEGEIGEKRLATALGLIEVLDDLAGIGIGRIEVLRQRDRLAVLAIIGARRLGRIKRDDAQLVAPVAGASRHLGKGAIEAAAVDVLVVAQMPLAGHQGSVAGIVQHLRQRHHAVVQTTLVAWLASNVVRHQLGHVTETDQVVVGARHQDRAGGRTEGRRVVAGQADAAGGQFIQVGRVDLGTEGTNVVVAEVVGDNQQDVRSLGGLGAGGRHRRSGEGAERQRHACGLQDAHRVVS